MKWFRQVLAVTNMNLLSITQRFGSSLVVIIGIAGSVAVMVSLLAVSYTHLTLPTKRIV